MSWIGQWQGCETQERRQERKSQAWFLQFTHSQSLGVLFASSVARPLKFLLQPKAAMLTKCQFEQAPRRSCGNQDQKVEQRAASANWPVKCKLQKKHVLLALPEEKLVIGATEAKKKRVPTKLTIQQERKQDPTLSNASRKTDKN